MLRKLAIALSGILLLSFVLAACQTAGTAGNETTDAKDEITTESTKEEVNDMGYEQFSDKDTLYVNKNNITSYCNTNEALLPAGKKVTGIVLEFPGLDGNSCLGGTMNHMTTYNNAFTQECAAKGLVVAYMFPGPWSWMNKGAVRIIDLVVDAFMDKYGFETEEDFTLVVMGGSMGGLGALIYTIDTRHTVDACVSHCPCYNVIECYDANPAFPRTFLAAVNDYDMPLEDALKQISPEHRIADMPDIPYIVTADELDDCFPYKGVQRLADKMSAAGLKVTYMFLEGQQHGGMSAEDRETVNEFIFKYSKSAN